ncbi:MAG: deoxyguanosinetriphosphate triphosphohydrolase [Alphaproteobacteria bacterium]
MEKKEILGDFEYSSGTLKIVKDGDRNARIGLNLAYRSLASILKYDKIVPAYRDRHVKVEKGVYDVDREFFEKIKKKVAPESASNGEFKTIECAIMDIADDIAYSTYDLEDTLKAGFLTPLDIVAADQELLEAVARKVAGSTGTAFQAGDVAEVLFGLFGGLFDIEAFEHSSSKYRGQMLASQFAAESNQLASNGYLRTKFTSDLVSEFLAGVECIGNDQAPAMSRVRLKRDTLLKVETLKHYTYAATIMSPRLRIVERRSVDIVRKMFETLASNDGFLLMPPDYRDLYQQFSDDSNKRRVVCDFIAGMTDRYALEFYGRLYSENPQSFFKPF